MRYIYSPESDTLAIQDSLGGGIIWIDIANREARFTESVPVPYENGSRLLTPFAVKMPLSNGDVLSYNNAANSGYGRPPETITYLSSDKEVKNLRAVNKVIYNDNAGDNLTPGLYPIDTSEFNLPVYTASDIVETVYVNGSSSAAMVSSHFEDDGQYIRITPTRDGIAMYDQTETIEVDVPNDLWGHIASRDYVVLATGTSNLNVSLTHVMDLYNDTITPLSQTIPVYGGTDFPAALFIPDNGVTMYVLWAGTTANRNQSYSINMMTGAVTSIATPGGTLNVGYIPYMDITNNKGGFVYNDIPHVFNGDAELMRYNSGNNTWDVIYNSWSNPTRGYPRTNTYVEGDYLLVYSANNLRITVIDLEELELVDIWPGLDTIVMDVSPEYPYLHQYDLYTHIVRVDDGLYVLQNNWYLAFPGAKVPYSDDPGGGGTTF